jgi:hypothetical protein
MFVQLFRSYFSEEIFSWSLSEWLSAQVGVFPKAKTGKHKGEIQNTPMKKKLESKEIQTTKKKHTQKVHLKTSCDNPLGN